MKQITKNDEEQEASPSKGDKVGTALVSKKEDEEKLQKMKTAQEKFDILGQYFGIAAIKMAKPTEGNPKRFKKQLKRLVREGSVIGHDVRKMKEILKILNKPSEKRQDKDVAQLVPLLKELKFFKERRPMNDSELLEIAYNGQYEFHEPGDVVYN